MTDLIVTAGSAAVVLLLIGMAFALGFRGAMKLDESRLAALAAAEGARVENAIVGADGRTGVAQLSGGKLLIAKVMGEDVSTRVVPAGGAQVRFRNGRLTVTFGDLGYPSLHMRLDQEPAWLAAMHQGQPT
jgi:hypothetical protein